MKNEKADKIINNIYIDLYNHIGVNFLELDKSKSNWFMDFELDEKDYKDIVEANLKGKRLTPLMKQAIRNSVLLGCSPKFTKE